MSASKDKILRKQQIEAGTDKRSIAAAEEAKKRRKSNIQYAVIGALLVVFFAFIFIYNSALPSKLTKAVTIDGEDYSVAQMNYYYSSSYNSFYNNYYSYISYGLFFDTSTSLDDQMYSEDMTWREYFLESALDNMTEIQVLNKAAEEAGFVLSDEDQAAYENAIASIETSWSDLGYSSLEQYINMNYGKGVTLDLVKEELYRTYVASAYAQAVYDGYEYTDEEVAAYYAEHADENDMISYAYYVDSEGVIDAAAIADAVNGTDEETFTAYMEENYGDIVPSTVTYAGSNLPELYAEWLLDPARTAGDAANFEEDDTTTAVVMFLDRDANDYEPVSFRHILIQAVDADEDGEFSQEEIDAAAAQAEEIYAEWQAGAADEDSFAQLANLYSEDSGSNTTGGLYETVIRNQMVEPINDWLFDAARQPGDTEVLSYSGANYTGTHVVYFVGTDDTTYAHSLADSALRNEAYSDWMAAAEEAAVVVRHHMGMCGKNH